MCGPVRGPFVLTNLEEDVSEIVSVIANRRAFLLTSAAITASLILGACAPAAPAAPAATTAPGSTEAAPTEAAPAATSAATSAPTEGATAEATPAGTAETTAEATTTAPATKLRVKYIVNGTLGDKSYFDGAERGVQLMKSELGYDVQTVELGYDRNKWEPGLEDAAASDDYDAIVVAASDMMEYVQKIAPQYPDKKFWLFDGAPDFSACSDGCKNVYSIYFLPNEGSYLLGIAIGELLKAGTLPGIGSNNKVGIICGLDIPGLNDFVVGFKQGFAESGLDPEANVIVQYVGGDSPFNNPAKGKEIAKAMFDQGAGIVWGVAGSTGNGAFEAAVEAKRYAVGVDSDQFQTIADPAQKAIIITSMIKKLDSGLLRTARLDAEGKLKYGATEYVGIAADAVGLADNENYQKFVSKEIQDKVTAAAAKVTSGEIKVVSAITK